MPTSGRGYAMPVGLRRWWRKQVRFNQTHWLEGLQYDHGGYRATCRCGWVGPRHESRAAAGGDGQDHLWQEQSKFEGS
jgi:hypothetical protein